MRERLETEDARPDTSAALVVLSEKLSAGELRAMIGLDPERSWERGDPIGRSGRANQRFSGWSLEVGPGKETAEWQISLLLDRTHQVMDRIASAAQDPRVDSVALWVWSAGLRFGIELPPSLMTDIARLGATLKIDVYDGNAIA
jgi:hypothetical protein